MACRQSERGDEVYAVGNPYGVLYASLTKGIVSSTERNTRMLHIDQSKDTQFIQFSAPIIGGNSGGALYNDVGELEGVVVRGGAPGFGLAVPLSDIKKIMSSEMLEDLWKRCGK
jgi:S1-C subfamily serine protease